MEKRQDLINIDLNNTNCLLTFYFCDIKIKKWTLVLSFQKLYIYQYTEKKLEKHYFSQQPTQKIPNEWKQMTIAEKRSTTSTTKKHQLF